MASTWRPMRTRTTTAAAVSMAVILLAVGGPAAASPRSAMVSADPEWDSEDVNPGALPALGPAERAVLLKSAEADLAATAHRLGLGRREKLKVIDVERDADGTVHTHYDRTYAGLDVYGGDLVTHTDRRGGLLSVAREAPIPLRLASLVPSVSALHAQRVALKSAAAAGLRRGKAGRATKIVWAARTAPVLGWVVSVEGVLSDGSSYTITYIINGSTGATLLRYSNEEYDKGIGQYGGKVLLGATKATTVHTLDDKRRGGLKTYDALNRDTNKGTLFTNPTRHWGDGKQTDRRTAAVDAHYGAERVWDFFKNVHGRLGIAGDGKPASILVHYGNNYNNASWLHKCFCVRLGDGTGNSLPQTALDTMGHEWSHGVTEATAQLLYAGESGALNEATSDIFGVSLLFYVRNPKEPGSYFYGRFSTRDGKPMRYMDMPSKDGHSSDYWYPGIDKLDVHYSSGPANHFFYLLAEGSGAKTIDGVHYDSPTVDGLPVTGIGRVAAGQIWYRALTVYMTSLSDYAAARTATLHAAADLFGKDSHAHHAVADAWAAVGVGKRSSRSGE